MRNGEREYKHPDAGLEFKVVPGGIDITIDREGEPRSVAEMRQFEAAEWAAQLLWRCGVRAVRIKKDKVGTGITMHFEAQIPHPFAHVVDQPIPTPVSEEEANV